MVVVVEVVGQQLYRYRKLEEPHTGSTRKYPAFVAPSRSPYDRDIDTRHRLRGYFCWLPGRRNGFVSRSGKQLLPQEYTCWIVGTCVTERRGGGGVRRGGLAEMQVSDF